MSQPRVSLNEILRADYDANELDGDFSYDNRAKLILEKKKFTEIEKYRTENLAKIDSESQFQLQELTEKAKESEGISTKEILDITKKLVIDSIDDIVQAARGPLSSLIPNFIFDYLLGCLLGLATGTVHVLELHSEITELKELLKDKNAEQRGLRIASAVYNMIVATGGILISTSMIVLSVLSYLAIISATALVVATLAPIASGFLTIMYGSRLSKNSSMLDHAKKAEAHVETTYKNTLRDPNTESYEFYEKIDRLEKLIKAREEIDEYQSKQYGIIPILGATPFSGTIPFITRFRLNAFHDKLTKLRKLEEELDTPIPLDTDAELYECYQSRYTTLGAQKKVIEQELKEAKFSDNDRTEYQNYLHRIDFSSPKISAIKTKYECRANNLEELDRQIEDAKAAVDKHSGATFQQQRKNCLIRHTEKISAERDVAFNALEVIGSILILVGVLTGMPPLIYAGVSLGFTSKIFEIADDHYKNNKLTRKIRRDAVNLFSSREDSKNEIYVEKKPNPGVGTKCIFTHLDSIPIVTPAIPIPVVSAASSARITPSVSPIPTPTPSFTH